VTKRDGKPLSGLRRKDFTEEMRPSGCRYPPTSSAGQNWAGSITAGAEPALRLGACCRVLVTPQLVRGSRIDRFDRVLVNAFTA
jgi:hypothetical protein